MMLHRPLAAPGCPIVRAAALPSRIQQAAGRRAGCAALQGEQLAAAAVDEPIVQKALVDRRASLAMGLAALAAASSVAGSPAWADEGEAGETAAAAPAAPAPSPSSSTDLRNVFLDVSIEGEPVGRIVIALFQDVTLGSARFEDLAIGGAGVGFTRRRIDGIFDTHIRVEGVKRLSYSATGDSNIAGGDSLADLQTELTAPNARKHDAPGLVSLIIEEAEERPITEKLIAKNGKLVTIQLQAGEAPNGTGFMITRSAAPELDRTNLVVGKVIEGMDVVEKVAALPFSKPRVEWYDGPFFEAGKAMGDKRATVAEKGFNRPFKRVIVTKSGLL